MGPEIVYGRTAIIAVARRVFVYCQIYGDYLPINVILINIPE
jgi:hypothetical protein